MQPICRSTNQTLPAGMSIMDFGQDKPLQFSLLTPDGFIFQPIPCLSTTLCQDSKVNSQDTSPHGPTSLKAHSTTGFTKVQTPTAPGFSPKESGDGWNGMTVPTSSSLTSQKQDGTTSQIVDSTLNKTQDTASIIQNTFITTTCTQTSTSNQDKQEVLRDQHPTISYKRENSVMKADGEFVKHNFYLKIDKN